MKTNLSIFIADFLLPLGLGSTIVLLGAITYDCFIKQKSW